MANNYLNFSTGEYLDELVALIGIKRNEEVRPIAELEISVNSATFLPKGSKFTDGKGHFAFLLEDANIADEATLKIEAGGYFKENYETTTLEIPNIYVKTIKMTKPFSGFKARENDDELRNRFLLALHRFSTAGSQKSYLFYILSIEGITKANVYHLSPGVVQIVYFSRYEKNIAEAKISEALKDRVPLTDNVLMKEATQIKFDLVIEVRLKHADEKLREYFANIGIGFTPHFSQLIEIAFDENTRAVEIKTPIPNSNRDSLIILNSLQILKAD